MLNNIRIQKVASYRDEQALLDLATVNFIYGDNGSGKSTIANYIKDANAPEYADCALGWDAFGSVDTLVYDREFVDNTLRETKVKGVFTFGDGAGPKHDQLEKKLSERDNCDTDIIKLQQTIESKEKDLHKEQDDFKEGCWGFQKKYKAKYIRAVKGFGTKAKFKDECIKHITRNPKLSTSDLEKYARTFFSDQPTKLPNIPVLSIGNIKKYEEAQVFKAKIVGKEDIPIAGLINTLGSSDWVKRGIEYFSGTQCPFCQQLTPESLKAELESYFDEEYNRRMSALKNATGLYISEAQILITVLEGLKAQESEFFVFSTIEASIQTLKAKMSKNIATLELKQREPSREVELDSLMKELEIIIGLTTEARKQVIDFNLKMDDYSKEQKSLIGEVWAHIGSECKALYESHTKRSAPYIKAISAMQDKLKGEKQNKEGILSEIKGLERELVSISPSKDVINEILNSFGFTNFQIVEDREDGYYQIKRDDGSIAADSLSEGERTFITFLYFYQLIRGSVSQEGITRPRIVVFDDPVSSLDSKILFIVSTLIRSLFCSDILTELNVQQIVIMTHNLYFHKEISFMKGLRNLTKSPLKVSQFSYWVVRKHNGVSKITHHAENPIKTNYQLLWQEVKNSQNAPQVSPTICNTLRRILENYFGILGGIDIASIPNYFEGNEQLVCKSMTSWVHDGSHCIFDGIEVGTGQEYTEHYLPIFKKIFQKTDQIAHYEMMINSC